jgi:hypothetical protein
MQEDAGGCRRMQEDAGLNALIKLRERFQSILMKLEKIFVLVLK